MTSLEVITRQHAAGKTVVSLQGVIDADAKERLETLLSIENPAVLDFSAVQRVNSMGLAILLNILKQLQTQGIAVHAEGMNRMTAMLFKMTGLNQYLQNPPASAPVRGTPAPIMTRTPTGVPSAPTDPSPSSHWRFSVSLQDRGQLESWYFLNTHLQRHWGHTIRLEPHFGALDQDHAAPIATSDMVFASPFVACELIDEGFLLLMFPCGDPEEAVIVRLRDDERKAWGHFTRPKILTARIESYVYLLGRMLIDETGYSSDDANYLFVGNDMKSIQMLLRNMGDIAVLPRQTFSGLASITRSALEVMDESRTDFAYHTLCLSPHRKSTAPKVKELFLSLKSDTKGQNILRGLGIHDWREPAQEEISMLTEVYHRYAGSG